MKPMNPDIHHAKQTLVCKKEDKRFCTMIVRKKTKVSSYRLQKMKTKAGHRQKHGKPIPFREN